jgi:hypothetical protein
MGWTGIKNGKLLQFLKENGFDYWIVVDKNIPYQQNIAQLPCPIIILDVIRNTLNNIEPLLPKIIEILESKVIDKIVIIK